MIHGTLAEVPRGWVLRVVHADQRTATLLQATRLCNLFVPHVEGCGGILMTCSRRRHFHQISYNSRYPLFFLHASRYRLRIPLSPVLETSLSSEFSPPPAVSKTRYEACTEGDRENPSAQCEPHRRCRVKVTQ